MGSYIIRRLLFLIPVLLFVTVITFSLMHIAPGGPWDREKKLPEAVQANLNAKYHLDEPLPVQYGYYLLGLVRGDLGLSFTNPGYSVQEVIGRGLGVTVQLGLLAAGLAVLIGIPLGVIAALRQNTLLDYGSMFLAILGYTTPSFVLAIFMIVIFAVRWHVLPPGGWGKPESMIMPILALSAAPIAVLARYTRASMLEIVRQDYVRTARAKGLDDRIVII